MKFSSSVFILFFLFIAKVQSQNYELGKVTIAELEEKAHPKDSSAPAAILFKKGRTVFNYVVGKGFIVNNVYEFRIKIYKPEGLSWANQKVSYYAGYENLNDDSVNFSNAVTYNLEKGSIVKTKLNSEGSFKNKINKYWNQATITLPNVKAGSVIEFKYVLKSENVVRLPDFEIQYDVPVNFFEYKTEIPEFFIYKTLFVGKLKIESKADVVQSGQVYFNGYKQINAAFTASNIPALKEEKFVDNIENYRGAIRNELERKRFPDEPVVNYTTTWEEVAKNIYKSESFGKELKEKDYFAEDLKTILHTTENHQEKLDAIFKFVQNKMNWNKEKGYLTDKGVKKAYLAQTGNTAEINFILISMLKSAGIAANPVLVSTVENGVPVFPNRTDFNYVIGSAEIDGKKILLDASNKFTTPGILPLNLLNWKGRLIKEDGSSEEIEMIPSVPSKEIFTVIAEINPENKKMEGNVKVRKTDYSALLFREKNTGTNEESYVEKLENDLNKIEINGYSIENKKDNFSKSTLESFDFTSYNSYDVIGEKIYIKPILFYTDTTNPFKQEQRQLPVYFGYPVHQIYNVFYDVPQGYTVESLPKPIKISTENNGTSYIMNMDAEENRVQIKVGIQINSPIFTAEEYDMLKEFFQKIIASQNEKIVLKRI
ncbi:transglutaminase-like putative cysteine protease [Flavobacterium sp. HSC-32F16]|uniref:DUF3857 domain-containing protein n=1 Tax=Flavobacterium sp. HSC-32F16 TaxID=2910964 RepID=UPI0020A2D88B|nr:DUF3857 domain-containing protein [Flavobacterium sp. HSC-32F16]MCP2027938.1 transglutaminase-like putative cysteine protease [Flavobacterium sp. HSC-32F16]